MGERGREITTEKVAMLSCLANSHFRLFLHSKKHPVCHEDEEVKNSHCMVVQAVEFYDIVMKTRTQAKQMP
jgi:hypothetical protein